MSEIRSKLLAVFRTEHLEHLAGIRAALARPGEDASARGMLDEAFRRAHSLKGAARAVELRDIETLAHRVETLFSRVREGKMELDEPLLDAIHGALDMTEDWMAALSENRPAPDIAPALAIIERAMGIETPASPTPPAAPGVVPFFQSVETMRVSAQHLDRLLSSVGRLVVENQRQEGAAHEFWRVGNLVAELESEWARTRHFAGGSLRRLGETQEFARVSRSLSLLENKTHSLARQMRGLRMAQLQNAWTVRHIGEQLQQDVQRARMVPAGSVFEGFHKMVRDLARGEAKMVEFDAYGLEVEADRAVLQSLKDPVMHLLRNAVTHGIELPEERRQNGKSSEGRVSLRVSVRRNLLQLTVQDDGRGIDWKAVADVAARSRLVSASPAGPTARSELERCLFQPGFSTAQGVTELSGRGMGLSVVAEAVARLQGEVALSDVKGPGNGVTLSVPLLVSTHRLLLVLSRSRAFAIPVHGIERVARIKMSDVETIEGNPVARLQDQMIPLRSLAHVLAAGDPAVRSDSGFVSVVVVKSDRTRVAFAVDELLDQVDGLIKNLPSQLAGIPRVAGCMLRGDGSIVLVLNPPELIDAVQRGRGSPSLTTVAEKPQARTPSILVVDDSVTTRTLEKSILEAHGYHVDVVVDGVEAINFLRTRSADLIITDIQMPRMDGFALLEALKKDSRLTQVPVVLVTSLENPADKERGLALGADAYIVKRKFDQRDLLETIRQII
jgi:two-component system chemotaxis sensor kinase CheA